MMCELLLIILIIYVPNYYITNNSSHCPQHKKYTVSNGSDVVLIQYYSSCSQNVLLRALLTT